MKNYIVSERVDLFEPNIYINFLVKITGNPTAEALVAAVRTAFAANEATVSGVVLNENGDAFYERRSESGCKVSVSTDSWNNIMSQNEKMPFAIDQGELMRVFVIEANEETHLFIMAHHLVGDGKSVTYFTRDVMTALSGKSLEFKPLQLIDEASFPVKSKLPLPYKLYVKKFNKKWKRTGCTFRWEDYYNVHKIYWKEHGSEVVFEHFSPEEINGIHAHAKAIGVSVNSFITTAFLEAERENRTIGMAVNARPAGNKSMSNQTTGISVEHTYSDKHSFDENARLIHKKVQMKLENPAKRYFILRFLSIFTPAIIDSVLLYTYGIYKNKTSQKLSKALGYTGDKTRELGITNLTRLDIPDTYGRYGLENVLFIPPVVSYAKHIIGVVTVETGMTVAYHFMSDRDKEKEIHFFRQAISNLRKYV
jgi:hypothetical protein